MQEISFRNIFLVLVGGSPAVVTETLYGLYKNNQPLPDEIKIITTAFGKQLIGSCNLLGDDGHIASFCKQYQQPVIKTSESDVWVITNEHGEPLEDAKNLSQHNAMADFIVNKVRFLTQQKTYTEPKLLTGSGDLKDPAEKRAVKSLLTKQYENTPGFHEINIKSGKKGETASFTMVCDKYAIHASIAGGRKSMTFLLGYAMSLFGRPQDKVSHVLVDSRVEKFDVPFYYPCPDGSFEYTDKQGELIRFDNVEVSLAELPMVRFGANMPSVILQAERSYSETVAIFESIQHEPPCLELFIFEHPDAPQSDKPHLVRCSGHDAWLDKEAFAFLWGWCNLKEPVRKDDSMELALEILSCYAFLLSNEKFCFDDLLVAASTFTDELREYNTLPKQDFVFGRLSKAEITRIIETEAVLDFGGMLGMKYDHYRTYLKTKLAESLGETLASMYTPEIVGKAEDGDTLYAMSLPEHAISIYEQIPR